MVIAQLIETLDAGGAEALAVDIANELAARGLDSHVIVVDGRGRFRDRIGGGVTVHDLGRPRREGALPARVGYFVRTCRAVADIVSNHGIDVVQSHLPKANFFGLALALMRCARVHPTVHNNREFDYGEQGRFLIAKGRRLAYRLMLDVSAGMIAVSPEVKRTMADELGVSGRPAGRIIAVSNGVDCPKVPGPDVRCEARLRWGVTDDEVLLVSAGRLTVQKSFATLVAALESLPADLPPWRCIIGGEGELRSDLESQLAAGGLADRVQLAGHIEDLRDLMTVADVFCLSSAWEGLPLVMLEAMSAGLPVCAFGIPGVTDVVTDGIQGLLAEPGDERSLADAAARLITDGALRRRLGRDARRLVIEEYSFESMVDSLVSLYGGRMD